MIHLWLTSTQGNVRVLIDKQWRDAGTWQDAASVIKQANIKDDMVCLYAPSLDFTQITKPMSKAQLKQLGDEGVRYLIEDDVLGNIDELLVTHSMANDAEVALCAINKHTVASFTQSLSLVDLKLKVVLPDFLLLPEPKKTNEATLLQLGHTALLRLGSAEGISIDNISLLPKRMPTLESVHVIGESAEAQAAHLETLLENSQIVVHPRDDLTIAAVTHPERHAFNLMPKPKSKGLPRYTKSVITLACIAMATMLAYDALRVWRFKQLEKNYQSQIYSQYKQWFPNERAPVDIEKTIKSKMSNSGSDSVNLFSIFTSVSQLIKQNNMTANQISLVDERVEVSLTARDINALEGLVQTMTTQGLNASLGNVNSGDNDVQGIIKITP